MNADRRHEGEIEFADLAAHGAWRDVSGDEHDHAIYEPVYATVLPRQFDGFVVSDFTAANGATFLGTVEPRLPIEGGEKTFSEPRAALHYIWYRTNGTPAWACLYLGDQRAAPQDRRRRNLDAALASLGITAAELFPMTVRPRVQVEGFPSSWALEGFLETNQLGNPVWVV